MPLGISLDEPLDTDLSLSLPLIHAFPIVLCSGEKNQATTEQYLLGN